MSISFFCWVDGLSVRRRPFMCHSQLVVRHVTDELHATTVVTVHSALVRQFGDAPLVRECSKSHTICRFFANVDFECCRRTGADNDEHGDFAANDWPRIVFVVDEQDFEWTKMTMATQEDVDPPLASDTFEHVNDVDWCEKHGCSAAHGAIKRPM